MRFLLIFASVLLLAGCSSMPNTYYQPETRVEEHPYGWGYRVHEPDGDVYRMQPSVGGDYYTIHKEP